MGQRGDTTGAAARRRHYLVRSGNPQAFLADAEESGELLGVGHTVTSDEDQDWLAVGHEDEGLDDTS